ncbi:MAG TPA: DUF6599 family protein [Pyrinomonadaceae bacterium]|jgi:hypothetical protein
MRVPFINRLILVGSLFSLLFASVYASPTFADAAKLLPNKIGEATARGAAGLPRHAFFDPLKQENFAAVRSATRSYVSADGSEFSIQLFKTQSDSEAYALLTNIRLAQASAPSSPVAHSSPVTQLNGVGTAAISLDGRVLFFKGAAVASVYGGSANDNYASLVTFARSFAETLEGGSGEIPVLVKHLPDWETAQERAVYVVTQPALREVVPNQPVLDAISFDGGTEAVTATYEGGARLVIVEYATAQFAFDANAAINARLSELRGAGQPVPSAYRRVGNYAVFVFGAPDESAAAGLIDKVKYEQEVRWLGENPYATERANRAWLNMSTSVIVNTVKATGLAIVICLSIGGIFGGWIFARRRAQAALTEQFSDAGGMLRLNLDEMSQQTNAARLLGQGDK